MFLLFAGDDYYPKGGGEDLKGCFRSVGDAVTAHDPTEHDYDGGWANVLDLGTLEIVKWFSRGIWQESSEFY